MAYSRDHGRLSVSPRAKSKSRLRCKKLLEIGNFNHCCELSKIGQVRLSSTPMGSAPSEISGDVDDGGPAKIPQSQRLRVVAKGFDE